MYYQYAWSMVEPLPKTIRNNRTFILGIKKYTLIKVLWRKYERSHAKGNLITVGADQVGDD